MEGMPHFVCKSARVSGRHGFTRYRKMLKLRTIGNSMSANTISQVSKLEKTIRESFGGTHGHDPGKIFFSRRQVRQKQTCSRDSSSKTDLENMSHVSCSKEIVRESIREASNRAICEEE